MSTSFRLVVPLPIYEAMLEHLRANLPNEGCGLLAGRLSSEQQQTQYVTHHYPLVNALASPTEFESEPRSMFLAFKEMRHLALEVFAIYHSHPTSAPVPSRKDLARNYSSEVLNLIVGLGGAEPELRAWWLTDAAYREGEVEIRGS